MTRLTLTLTLAICVAGYARAGGDDITCAKPVPINGSLEFHRCEFPLGKYGPPNFPMQYGVGYNVPYPMPHNHSLPIVMTWRPYGDETNCPNNNGAQPGAIIVNNCNDYYPNESYHAVGNVNPLGWGGYFFGLSTAYRTDAALDKAQQLWPDSIDQGAGITLTGKSYGGADAWHAPLMLGLINSPWLKQITKVLTIVPPIGIQEPGGLLERDGRMKPAWAGYDASALDHLKHVDQLRMIYFSTQFASNDHTVYANIPWIRKVCEQVACRALWGDYDHSWPPPADIKLPWGTWFDAPDMDARLDDPFLIVFSNSSANEYGPVGHINLGLSWLNAGMKVTPTSITAPIAYVRTAAGQPEQAIVNVIIRPRTTIQLRRGDLLRWTLGNQSGQTAVVTDGEVSVPVTLQSGADYSNLVIVKTGEVVPGC